MAVIPQNILLVSDAADAALVRDALSDSSEEPFQVAWVRSCEAAVARLRVKRRSRAGNEARRRNPYVAVLTELYLPDSRGLETIERMSGAAPQLPILILAAAQHEDVARVAVRKGAHDYLLKGHLDGYLVQKVMRNMLERAANAEALFQERERSRVALESIGEAVISVDVAACVTYLNVAAERLTGWSREEATGRPASEVFRLVDGLSRQPAENPLEVAASGRRSVGLTPNCVLVRRDAVESTVEHSAAPVHDRCGKVTGAVMVFHDVSAGRALSVKMSYLAQHDSLTDLPNRLLLHDRLAQAITLARRHRNKLAVLFLDVDRFKHVNDFLGHDIGDRLLQSIATRLLACVRRSDTVSRQGGDEFVVLLSEIARAQDAAGSAEKILSALSAAHSVDNHELRITASIGIAIYPDDAVDPDVLMKRADLAMYHAKEHGRNNYEFFAPDLNVRALERQYLESGLRQALEHNEFVLHYQPKTQLHTGAIVGAEALIRWNHPVRGLIYPAQFISIAEISGLAVAMGNWVLREACRQGRAWQLAGILPMGISINISAAQLRDKDFIANVRAALAESGLPPQDLELELNESILMQDPKAAAQVLQQLKALRVQLALDDFGTGYSSLTHLQRFSIDILKIDQSFVHDLSMDSGAGGIVSAVIGMGRNLGMRVVAEGVESREQLAFLKQQECPEAQGYYFSRPLSAADFARLYSRKTRRTRAARPGAGDSIR